MNRKTHDEGLVLKIYYRHKCKTLMHIIYFAKEVFLLITKPKHTKDMNNISFHGDLQDQTKSQKMHHSKIEIRPHINTSGTDVPDLMETFAKSLHAIVPRKD